MTGSWWTVRVGSHCGEEETSSFFGGHRESSRGLSECTSSFLDLVVGLPEGPVGITAHAICLLTTSQLSLRVVAIFLVQGVSSVFVFLSFPNMVLRGLGRGESWKVLAGRKDRDGESGTWRDDSVN